MKSKTHEWAAETLRSALSLLKVAAHAHAAVGDSHGAYRLLCDCIRYSEESNTEDCEKLVAIARDAYRDACSGRRAAADSIRRAFRDISDLTRRLDALDEHADSVQRRYEGLCSFIDEEDKS